MLEGDREPGIGRNWVPFMVCLHPAVSESRMRVTGILLKIASTKGGTDTTRVVLVSTCFRYWFRHPSTRGSPQRYMNCVNRPTQGVPWKYMRGVNHPTQGVWRYMSCVNYPTRGAWGGI